MIVIVDYGMGNLGSLANMIKKVGGECEISADTCKIMSASKLILPGVGSFDAAMTQIARRSLRQPLDDKALEEKCPVLGVCLGMQILTSGSEEGKLPGLGWIPGRAIRFRPTDRSIKVPHMGWNTVTRVGSSPLTDDLPSDARFYFVHSYHVHVENHEHRVLTTAHGVEFDSFIQNRNVIGAQFHPEKSHRFGMTIVKAFVEL